jgi:serine/threonine-protein phosphatase 2A regulatory subunit B
MSLTCAFSVAQGARGGGIEYRYLTEFQSHEPEVRLALLRRALTCAAERARLRCVMRARACLHWLTPALCAQFDYLKSLEIEEKINKIRWCQQGANASRFLLSTNDKTIKLWKVSEKRVKSVTNFNCAADERSASGALAGPSSPLNGAMEALGGQPGRARPVFADSGALRLPSIASSEPVLAARCRRAYPNAHAYHINSISVNSDGATFISADDLRINLWSLDTGSGSFTIVDIKPDNMENLTEVITAAVFHPSNCALFAYSSSKGCIRMADMRERALCERHAKLYEETEVPGTRSFFSEIIASISDVQFGAGGRYLLARDYLTLKVWDVAMESRPLATFSVHEALRGKLCDLYENDAIFDKFECAMSGDGANVATGTYSNLFRVFATGGEGDACVEASKDPQRLGSDPARPRAVRTGRGDAGSELPTAAAHDYSAKLLHMAWHPLRNVVAAAAGNSLYIVHSPPPQPGSPG